MIQHRIKNIKQVKPNSLFQLKKIQKQYKQSAALYTVFKAVSRFTLSVNLNALVNLCSRKNFSQNLLELTNIFIYKSTVDAI